MRETERDGGEGRKTREAKGATPSSAVTTKPTKKTPRRAPKAEPNPVNTLVRHQSANLSFEPNPEPNRAQRNKSRAPKQLVRYIRDLETFRKCASARATNRVHGRRKWRNLEGQMADKKDHTQQPNR
jgi:hypothetical protein